MFNAITLSIQMCFVSSNLVPPEYSLKILNTENVILSMGNFDIDTDNELELLKKGPKDPNLDEKLNNFHKFVKINQEPEKTIKKVLAKPYQLSASFSDPEISYLDFPIKIAVDRKALSKFKRRRRKKKKHLGRKMRVWGVGKRELTAPKVTTNTEDDHLTKDYLNFVATSQNEKTAYKYSNQGKPEETCKEVWEKITDIKMPKNCTNVTGIGIQAIQCIIKNYKNKQISNWATFKKISIILLVWFCIYLAVTIPLWCTRGWCCCCCRCSFCLPRKTVKEIKKYITQNPPGIHVNSKGEEEHYNPSIRETELYERLKMSIADF